jgi:excisionase family DNA binding protein
MPELLTTEEAATYLRLSERKLYELVANGAVPCTKITGKWLFPKAALDRWLAAGLAAPAALAPPPPILGGSHDPLLEWALRESGSELATLPEGSEAGLTRLARGEVSMAAIHLHRLDGDDDAANLDAVASAPGLYNAVVIAFARREQGLLVAPGNPLGIGDVAGIAARRARLTLRPQGAGAQLLLLALMARAGIPLNALTTVKPDLPDRSGRRPGSARRARRLRYRHAFGGASRWARLRTPHRRALRPRAAPARLFSAGPAGAVRLPAHRRLR